MASRAIAAAVYAVMWIGYRHGWGWLARMDWSLLNGTRAVILGSMAVFVRRLFGIGKVDKAFRLDLGMQVDAEGLIYLADYVAVTRRFSGTIPGVRLPHSVASTRSEVNTSDPV
ncbi:hypothetical protein MAHJHV51_52690 [Mycobacterium avium subsp. hominissuis]